EPAPGTARPGEERPAPRQCPAAQFVRYPPDALGDSEERLILIAPCRHGTRVLGQALQLAKQRRLPVGRTQEDWDPTSLATLVPCKGAAHFHIVAILGGEEVGADEQQNQVGGLQMIVNIARPFSATRDLAIMPDCNDTFTLQLAEMRQELVLQLCVFVGV